MGVMGVLRGRVCTDLYLPSPSSNIDAPSNSSCSQTQTSPPLHVHDRSTRRSGRVLGEEDFLDHGCQRVAVAIALKDAYPPNNSLTNAPGIAIYEKARFTGGRQRIKRILLEEGRGIRNQRSRLYAACQAAMMGKRMAEELITSPRGTASRLEGWLHHSSVLVWCVLE